jgi:hypothetical protein
MSLSILLSLALAVAPMCPSPLIINHTKEWTTFDAKTLARAKIRCGQLYPNSPCVQTFMKTKPLTYQVICTAAPKNGEY